MENQQPIFIFASPDIQEILTDNQISIADILRQKGFDVSEGFAKDPAQGAGSGYKDAATVILASAALVAAFTPIISQVISTLAHRAVLVREMTLLPVVDDKGNVVRDASGEPKLYWAPHTRLVESTEPRGASSVSVQGLGIKISLD
jgi:hypothetical protein